MNDVTGAASGGADGGQGGGAGAAAIAGAGGDGGQGGGATPSWRDTLPEALRGDASLANFADVSALAQGFVDSKRALTARAPDYSTEAGLKSLGDTLRPAEATAYEIPVKEGAPTETADKFRAFAHQIGMPPAWAKAVAEFHNSELDAATAAGEAASQKEVDTLKAKMGAAKFDAKLGDVQRMLPQLGVTLSDDDLAALDAKIGSGNLLSFMFAIHDRIGDPAPVEGDDVTGAGSTALAMTPDQANARWSELVKDKDWRAKAKVAGSPESKEYTRLNGIIAAGRAAAQKAPRPS